MKTFKLLTISSFIICLLVSIGALLIGEVGLGTLAHAASGAVVKKVTRIAHPAYRMNNLSFGVHNPWNVVHTRILLYEAPGFTDPDTGEAGRGLVTGTISDLKSWTTLSQYKAAAKPLPSPWNYNLQPNFTYWSPHAGEENIIYGMDTSAKVIKKINVDTGVVTTVTSYDPGDGTDISGAYGLGFTKTSKGYIVSFKQEY